jgi:hypothetical protein|tara:strand:- start:703 stop:1101 length:399 start_codon:yes stop_codon:yes gene_type:complete
MTTETNCKDKVQEVSDERLADLQTLFDLYCEDSEAYHDELGTKFDEYGLCFDYIKPYTFNDQEEAYYRYQLSWGGPSEEIRFYVSQPPESTECYKIEFWYLNWSDGACVDITKHDTARTLWGWFQELLPPQE